MKIQNRYLDSCYKQSFVWKGSFKFYRFFCHPFVNGEKFSTQTYTQISKHDFFLSFWGGGGFEGFKNDISFSGYQAKGDKKRQGEGGGS